MKKTDLWMPFYVGDYLRDTLNLSTLHHGAYVLLLAHYWVTAKPLPDNDAELGAIAKMTPEQWRDTRPILARLFQVADGVWRHKRVEKELVEARDNKQRQAARTLAARMKRQSVTDHVTGHVTKSVADTPSPSPSPSTTTYLPGEPVKSGFKAPSLEEARLHATKIGLPNTQAELFWNYYESKGWKVGKAPMKSWERAMTGWKLRYEEARNGNRGNRNTGTMNENRPNDYGSIGDKL